MLYLVLKYVHLIGASVLLGTGAGIAFFMLLAHLAGDSAETCPRCAATVGLHSHLQGGCPRCAGLLEHGASVTISVQDQSDRRYEAVPRRLAQNSANVLQMCLVTVLQIFVKPSP